MDEKVLPAQAPGAHKGRREHVERAIRRQRISGFLWVAAVILLILLGSFRYRRDGLIIPSKCDIKSKPGFTLTNSIIQDNPQCPNLGPADGTSRCASPCLGLGPNIGCLLTSSTSSSSSSSSYRKNEVLGQLRAATNVVRNTYFLREVGTWRESIDWTAAFTQTVLTAVMRTYVEADGADRDVPALFVETVASYYGQDALAIRCEAFDDMLWVVLGWLEAVRTIQVTLQHHHSTGSSGAPLYWYGADWIPAFSHRSRVFWDLARHGWNSDLCGGGMSWNKDLDNPYKNAITNELWIAASSAMWLYFPGDNNPSPFAGSNDLPGAASSTLADGQNTSGVGPVSQMSLPALPVRNQFHLDAAIKGYSWFGSAGFKNSQGLYIDGFHITNVHNGGKSCDDPWDMVFTYNQGVILTGQKNLWRATGEIRYLEDAHQLIQDVIMGTGWDLARNEPIDDLTSDFGYADHHLPRWRGLGRGGIMEEACDSTGDCNQDQQTFKGIFFHHMTDFCEALPPRVELAWVSNVHLYDERKAWHASRCQSYLGWVSHNAGAALGTVDSQGRAGMWWGASLFAPGTGRPDPNDRNRGRTLETQVGLVALLRAYHSLLPENSPQLANFWSRWF